MRVGSRAYGLLSGFVLLIVGAQALAHHSYAMFDTTRTVRIQGSVKEVHWTNPHVSIELEVSKGNGFEHYKIEASPVTTLKAAGFKRTSLNVGDKVTLLIYPLRDGRPGGFLYQAILASGEVLTAGTGEEKSPGNVSTK